MSDPRHLIGEFACVPQTKRVMCNLALIVFRDVHHVPLNKTKIVMCIAMFIVFRDVQHVHLNLNQPVRSNLNLNHLKCDGSAGLPMYSS